MYQLYLCDYRVNVLPRSQLCPNGSESELFVVCIFFLTNHNLISFKFFFYFIFLTSHIIFLFNYIYFTNTYVKV